MQNYCIVQFLGGLKSIRRTLKEISLAMKLLFILLAVMLVKEFIIIQHIITTKLLLLICIKKIWMVKLLLDIN